jgi:flagella basal body P-ring formation protein FlgA
MIPLISMALAGCLAVGADSDQILARDLVPVYPEMASLEPATPVAHAPEPGVSRIFHAADLRTLAVRLGLPVVPDHEFCVERPVSPLDPAQLLTAMKIALPQAQIEILDYSRQPAPAGEIEFSRQGLRDGSLRNGSLWTGGVRYAGNRRFVIWARVKVVASVRRVVALGDLKPERPIEAGLVVEQVRDEFPATGDFAAALDQVTGKWPRLMIRAGAEIRLDQLTEPKQVARGDRVRVDVFTGGAHLELEGIAECSGAAGETIPVRNPDSNRRFRARVEGQGRVLVDGNSVKVIP